MATATETLMTLDTVLAKLSCAAAGWASVMLKLGALVQGGEGADDSDPYTTIDQPEERPNQQPALFTEDIGAPAAPPTCEPSP